jgi:hypothetical protein
MTDPDALTPQLDAAAKPRATWLDVVIFSVLITCASAVFAGLASVVWDAEFSVIFVITRWCVVGVLILTPLLSQLTRGRLPIPLAMRTPWTALLLTVESIAFDILSANI